MVVTVLSHNNIEFIFLVVSSYLHFFFVNSLFMSLAHYFLDSTIFIVFDIES